MADQAQETTTVRAGVEACWRAVTDFDRYTQWAGDIKAVQVEERDSEGRGVVVAYRVGAFGRSTSYALRYDHSGAPTRLAWVQETGDITRRLDGSYEFNADGDGTTTVTYELLVELKVPLPGFVKQRAAARIIATALRDLKRHVEAHGASGASG